MVDLQGQTGLDDWGCHTRCLNSLMFGGLQEYCVVLRQPTTSHRCIGFLFSIQRTQRHGQLEDLSIAPLCHDAQLALQQK